MVFISGMVPNSAPLKKDKPFKLAPNSRHVCLNIGELARPCVSWIKDSCLELLYPRLWEGPQSVCVCVHELVWNWPPPSPSFCAASILTFTDSCFISLFHTGPWLPTLDLMCTRECGVAGGKGYHSVWLPVVPAVAMLQTTGSFRSIYSAKIFSKGPLYNVQKPFKTNRK